MNIQALGRLIGFIMILVFGFMIGGLIVVAAFWVVGVW
jgi:hypothetical protein